MLNPFTQKRWIIQVVDSSEALVNLTCETLKSDYDTLMSFNGADAVAQYKSLRPDLVVMEVEMKGGVDGFEACRQIKEYAGRRFIPIIFTSNNSDLQSIKKGLQNGAEDYLGKPFEQEELFVRIQATLRTKKLYTQLMQAYEIIENERNIVGEIQQSLLCENPSTISGFNFFSTYPHSSKAGGDYFDFIQIDDDHLGVLVADVSGHGTPAAVIMAMKRILLRSFLSKIRSPRETLEKLNSILCENVRSGHFITAFYGVIHLPTRSMKYASAGHNPPILVDYNTGDVRELWADTGFPLMISPENIMAEHEVQLHPNSKLVLYTDGLTEAKNHQGEVYGSKQLADSVSQLGKNLDAEGLGQKLLEEIQNFMDGASFHDDYTLVIVEIMPQ
ncbi:MAG: fused response regulator/phosphatase [Nitrospinae bacterium]|nr:fused response regulator/phosphatase [Nitrospinota bacterium]